MRFILRLAVAVSIIASGCSRPASGPTGGAGVPSVEEAAPARSAAPSTAIPTPAGPNPAVSRECPLTAPVLCPDGTCCPWGDTCAGNGQCQTTAASVRCPSGQSPCGAMCIPSGSACTLEASECPSSIPVPCDGGWYGLTGYNPGGYCCPAVLGCGPPISCTRASGTPPLNSITCMDSAGGWCPYNYACRQTTPVATCVPVTSGQPTDANCSGGVACNGVCCAGNTFEPRPTCGADAKCSFPTRTGTPAQCPTGSPTPCGSQCCGAADTCGSTCGCPAAAPQTCGAGCCAPSDGCSDGGSCTSCPSAWPVTCGASCCLQGASCTNGTCDCPPGQQSCAGVCCEAGAFCDSHSKCARCPGDAPVQCGDACCGSAQSCLQCSGESKPSCHDQACPSTGTGGSGGGQCSGVDHWEPKCNRCCNNGWTCCISTLSGQLDCVQPNWCQ